MYVYPNLQTNTYKQVRIWSHKIKTEINLDRLFLIPLTFMYIIRTIYKIGGRFWESLGKIYFSKRGNKKKIGHSITTRGPEHMSSLPFLTVWHYVYITYISVPNTLIYLLFHLKIKQINYLRKCQISESGV